MPQSSRGANRFRRRADRLRVAYAHLLRLMEHHAKLQKNQDRRLQRKNAAIIKEGGAPILLDRAPKADTSVRTYLKLSEITSLTFVWDLYSVVAAIVGKLGT
jgi:hypothetical protein